MLPSRSNAHFFCPADLHVAPIREQVLYFRDDAMELKYTFEEGQFDDA